MASLLDNDDDDDNVLRYNTTRCVGTNCDKDAEKPAGNSPPADTQHHPSLPDQTLQYGTFTQSAG